VGSHVFSELSQLCCGKPPWEQWERQEGANHFTATAAWLRRSLHKRTLRYVITPHCKASRPLPDVIGSSYGTLWSRSVPVTCFQHGWLT
jgi:hypothetical protein